MTVVCCEHDERVAFVVRQVDWDAGREILRQFGGLPLTSIVEESGCEGESFGWEVIGGRWL